jgi:hypothetical protein
MHSDSQGALKGIHAFRLQSNERRRVRMAARPLLQLIQHLLNAREKAAAVTTFSHVNTDVHSVGNRISDYRANLARQHPDRSSPWCSLQLHISDCERRLCPWEADGKGPLINDIGRTAMAQLKSSALTYNSDGSVPAGQGMLDPGANVLKHGTAHMQSIFLHIRMHKQH